MPALQSPSPYRHFGGLALIALVSCACSGHAARTEAARSALDARDADGAIAALNEELDVKTAEDLPDDVSGDNTLLLLDRAMILQQIGKLKLSSRDLEIADKQIELLDLSSSAADDIGKYIFSDDTGPYQAPAYEKLLINTTNIANYLMRGDLNGARIEARRLAVMQKYLRDRDDPSLSMSAPGSYLAGFTFERSNEPQEALRFYDEALQFVPFASLEEPVKRLSQRASYRSPRINKILGIPTPAAKKPEKGSQTATKGSTPPSPQATKNSSSKARPADPPKNTASKNTASKGSSSDSSAGTASGTKKASAGSTTKRFTDVQTKPATPGTPLGGSANPKSNPQPITGTEQAASADVPPAEVLVIVNFGRVPAKKAERIPIGLALTYASGAISHHDRRKANMLAAQGLVTWINYPSLGRARGKYSVPKFFVNGHQRRLEGALAVDREAARAWDAAKGRIIASAITRMIARLVAGEATRRISGGGLLGFLLSLTTQATLSAADTPDTRSWGTLPARIAIGRVTLPPGTHTIQLGARGAEDRQTLTLEPGGWAVLGLTVLY
ncbi:MAG: hypothetical protein HRU17_04160 [Polyangiaceae bacterium]|nr:hypothetical protein [Polyangiaceae bacterium]